MPEVLTENTADKTERNKMGYEPVGRLTLKMGLPLVISMIVQALYNIVDSIFVSRMPAKNKTNLAKTPLFSRFLSNSRLKYVYCATTKMTKGDKSEHFSVKPFEKVVFSRIFRKCV